MLAAQNGHTATVDLLLIRGAAIEAKDGDGWTALIWAAARGNTATVRLLLDRGASFQATGQRGETSGPVDLVSEDEEE